jgi:hypothetical protein
MVRRAQCAASFGRAVIWPRRPARPLLTWVSHDAPTSASVPQRRCPFLIRRRRSTVRTVQGRSICGAPVPPAAWAAQSRIWTAAAAASRWCLWTVSSWTRGDPQLDVRGGDLIPDRVRIPVQPAIQRAQRPQQRFEPLVPPRPLGADRSRTLRGRLDVLGVHPLDGLGLRLRAVRVQLQPTLAEAPGEVAGDVGCVRTHDAPGPVVAEDRREGRSGVPVDAASYSGRSTVCPPSGRSGIAGRKVAGQRSSMPSRLWATAMRRPSGQALGGWRR